ncbi:MAG: hypothetical protein CBARDCOR_6698 [uncultured Caballeronia sp.]|nr:MAG: hypothetical protein CBARDCOR_6698 [uncultured Caballeronia sp.]
MAEPAASSLADALSAVYADMAVTRKYGAAARALWNSCGINWPNTVETLLR